MESQSSTTSPSPSSPPSPDGCIVCYEAINQANRAVISGCSHEFCFECIINWAKTSLACPLCKQEFSTIQHSFKEDGQFTEEALSAPAAAPASVEDQLNCLDHGFFLGEVTRLLQGAERAHKQLWLGGRSTRGLNVVERRHLETVEGVCVELRNYKRRLQALLHFDPHSLLQDLYRLQGMLDEVLSPHVQPQAHHSHAHTHHHHQQQQHSPPVRYSADDAWEGDISDDDDFAEEMAYLSLAKNKQGGKGKPLAHGKAAGSGASQPKGRRQKNRG